MGVLVKGKTRNTRTAQENYCARNHAATDHRIRAVLILFYIFFRQLGRWSESNDQNRLGILFWQELVQVVMCSLPGYMGSWRKGVNRGFTRDCFLLQTGGYLSFGVPPLTNNSLTLSYSYTLVCLSFLSLS